MKQLVYTLLVMLGYFLLGMHLCNNPRQVVRVVRFQDIYEKLKTGDIIFTKAKNNTSLIQQYFFGSYVNHCAMIFRAHDNSLWVWDTGPSVGAYMTPLYEFVRHNWLGRQPPAETPPLGLGVSYVNPQKQDRIPELQQSMLFLRRLAKPLNQEKVLSFLQANLGRPYSYRFWMSAVNCITGLQPAHTYEHTMPGYFCSELMMLTYHAAGAVDLVKSPAASVMPKQFWMNDVCWAEGQTLLGAERLIGHIPPFIPKTVTHEQATQLWLEGARPDDKVEVSEDSVRRLTQLAMAV
jgi:hypothetical protein